MALTAVGRRWAPRRRRLPNLAIGSIAVAPGNPQTIFVGTGEGALTAGYTGAGLLLTMDGGDSWTELGQSTFAGLAVPRFLIDPTSGDLYAAAVFGVAGRGEGCTNINFDAPGQGVYRSTDLGVTWTLLYAGQTSDLEIDFTASPLHLLTVDQQKGAMYSFDGGATWNASTGLAADMGFGVGIELSMSPADPTLVFAGVGKSGGAVFVSHDGGVTFTETPGAPAYCGAQCYYDNSVLADPVDPNVLWLGGSLCGIWKTQNALAASPTWINVSAQNENCGQNSENWSLGFVHPDVHALAVVPGVSSHLYAATDGGIARTVDSGLTWERLNSGVSTIQFYAVCVDPKNPDAVYGGAQDNGSSMRVGTDTWRGIISGDGGFCAVNPGDSNNVLTTDTAGTVVLTLDRYAGPPSYPFATDPSFGVPNARLRRSGKLHRAAPRRSEHGEATFYIGTYRVYRSIDKGETWAAISGDVTAGSGSVQCVSTAFPSEDDTLTAIAVARKLAQDHLHRQRERDRQSHAGRGQVVEGGLQEAPPEPLDQRCHHRPSRSARRLRRVQRVRWVHAGRARSRVPLDRRRGDLGGARVPGRRAGRLAGRAPGCERHPLRRHRSRRADQHRRGQIVAGPR